MKAAETRIDRFLASSETAFTIPVYQRNYDWTKTQCLQLFKDILSVGEDESQTAHFIGSIVYVHDDVYSSSGVTELTIIDGQQRLTTLTLIYVAIYRFAVKQNNPQMAQRIFKTYLINEFAVEEEKLKLKPTDNNRMALAQILDPQEGVKVTGYSRLVENFRYFQDRITADNFETVLRGVSKLIFVDIALDRQKDNPQRIFESLNSTGLELSQADLIRNYILMGLPRKEQEKVYKNFWEPIEANARNAELHESRVSDFIRDYLTLKQKDIPNKGAVYEKFKERYPVPNSPELMSALEEIRRLSELYKKLLNPSFEPDPVISREIAYINTLEINTAYPFLLRVYQDYDDGLISKVVFVGVLKLVQSYVWRRLIIGLPTNALNKIFMGLYDRVEMGEYLESIERSLAHRTGTQRFPRDAEVVLNLKDKDMYNTKGRTRLYFFDRLENYQNNEHVDVSAAGITTEHIFPQNPDPAWKSLIAGEEYDTLRDKYLNTIGNLTLSGNNGKLGNKPFADKKAMNDEGGEQGYIYSRLWLNRDLQQYEEWGVAQVEERANRIAERFLKVWPAPAIEITVTTDSEEVNIFDAEEPRHKRLDHAVFLGTRLQVTQVTRLYTEVFKQLIELQPEAFHETKLGERIQLSADPQTLRQALQIADSYYIEGNIDSTLKFDRLKAALTDLGLEDDLLIKYA
ncbi:DUF262 domain-containing protein [Rhizobium pusense]|uniref:DUF262 domain-containing protein n=1 Tax=Agrobacterium pusense TaxID=648995 RepID=A0A6H0ZQQ0_9HYPH|nr:DUF262 domain-containing protein [Agrobacterium pusense]MDH2092553.1 DUF262 domain-containing protein [Agrobacterium pusense]QIX22110.1 DUF262 domain-containing protein [Agrobacterium pusense]WCK23995.1 DUF262 domain-containing protein [Agrobacterium pusense]